MAAISVFLPEMVAMDKELSSIVHKSCVLVGCEVRWDGKCGKVFLDNLKFVVSSLHSLIHWDLVCHLVFYLLPH